MKDKKTKKYKDILGSVVLNKINGTMSVHFHPKKNITIKKGQKLFLQGESFMKGLNAESFFEKEFYRVPIIEAFALKRGVSIRDGKKLFSQGKSFRSGYKK
jgi:hypothetical protein